MERWSRTASRRAVLAMIAVLALSIAPPGAGAAEPADKIARGPKVGERIPHALTAADQTGAQRDFNSVKSGRGLVLLFNRSVDW
jgi:hypothetical protein